MSVILLPDNCNLLV